MTNPLHIITLSEVQSEPVAWLWEPYIPRGKLTIVQGDGGGGKTTLLLAIAAAVTTSGALPGVGRVSPGAVLFQSAEDGLADTVKPRLERLGADCSRIHAIDEGEQSLTLADERIEQAIVRTGAKLLVLDPLQAYLGGADLHSAGGVRPLMKRLGAVAGRTGCAVVIIGHLNKRGGKAAYRGLGSIDLYAAARSVLTVGRVDDSARAFVQIKNNLAPVGEPQAFTIDGGFRWLGACEVSVEDLSGRAASSSSESQLGRAMRLIKAELTQGAVPAAEMERLAEGWGVSPKTLRRAKAELGVVSTKRGGLWYWVLPIEVPFREDGQGTDMTTLTILEEAAG